MKGLCISIAFVISTLAAPALAADAAHGKQVFQACAACHTDKPDALGPNLAGVVGRKAGAREDFRYSTAMTRANITWTAANLRDYIKDPQAKVQGNRMPYAGMPTATDRWFSASVLSI